MATTLPSLTDEPTLYPGCCFSLSWPLLATVHTLLLQSISIIPSTSNSISSPTADLQRKKEVGSGDDDDDDERSLVLSIGSGTGLLEELLHRYLNSGVRDRGDEISSSSATTSPPPTTTATTATPTGAADGSSGAGGCWRVEGVEVNHTVNLHLPEHRINHVSGTWAILESRARTASVLMFVYPRDGALVRRYIDAFMMREGGRVQLVFWLGPKCDWEETGFGSVGAGAAAKEELEITEIRSGGGLAEFEMLAAVRRKTA
ncbi:hypothetical protein NPX13_g895 [Xylaria arbuscula]|uniref:Uncharacterized protein n=1 Tax=Xylaria arbuscula TaxID=114810 RepID=A0A9W8TRN0_9PEZI|nr:hypothetical protein NPX13_g895 [Xylaria arbuscula]